jgi:hypothetical protein
VGWGGVDWIGLAQIGTSYEPLGSRECWETVKWLHNWRPLE